MVKKKLGVFFSFIKNKSYLEAFLDAEVVLNPNPFSVFFVDAVVVWGSRPRRQLLGFIYHKVLRKPLIRIEDGFIRSLGLPSDGAEHISLIVDDLGAYYDATRPSRLEKIIKDKTALSSEVLEKGQKALELIRRYRIHKFNSSYEPYAIRDEHSGSEKRVLVVDQTRGDASITLGMANRDKFTEMMSAAINENPDCTIYLKPHPSVLKGVKRGHFDFAELEEKGVRIIRDQSNPHDLVNCFSKIYVASSLLGFEALLAGRNVVCFGVPFYSGWGLTDDRTACARRGEQRTLLEVFSSAYIVYTRYLHPDTKKRTTLLEVLNYIIKHYSLSCNADEEVFESVSVES